MNNELVSPLGLLGFEKLVEWLKPKCLYIKRKAVGGMAGKGDFCKKYVTKSCKNGKIFVVFLYGL